MSEKCNEHSGASMSICPYCKIEQLKAVIQMCFTDACSQSGKISKPTARELMKHADTRA